jgi:SagB-type dehydrogenase family enzyme
VVEGRRSCSNYSEQPLTAEQLGELLFRVGRIRWVKAAPATAGGVGYAISDRPYASTGGLYELELYLSLDRCTGLPRGSYHYDPREHVLTLLSDSDAELAEMLDGAKVAAGNTLRPPVLITVASRISRLSWVYGGVAYATTLKHVGALEQMLQLAATAMGLASCRLAVGDGSVADEVLRLAWPVEVSVGEFLVGARR